MLVDGEDVFRIRNCHALRRRVGMVFPLPVGLPLSVYDNVAYAPRRAGHYDRPYLNALVEKCLRQAMLWDEVKDRLDLLGTRLSGGQQQRLTLARALSHQPEILCLDEFSIAIDPVTTMKIEDILDELKEQMTIVLVTNLVQQARRLADRTAFLSDSRLIEVDETEKHVHASGPLADGALRRRRLRLMTHPAAATPDSYSLETRGSEPLVRRLPGAPGRDDPHQAGPDHRADGPVRLRQDHAVAVLQPHQRALRQRHHHRRDHHSRQEHL